MAENALHYGDNLDVLRRHIDNESVGRVMHLASRPPSLATWQSPMALRLKQGSYWR
jgi:hypothetical protein